MSIMTESSFSTTKLTRTNIVGHSIDRMGNLVGGHNKILVIILAVTLPTLTCIVLLTLLIVYYRRRRPTTLWLKKLENSSRLQSIIVNLSPTSIQPQYSEKNLYLSHLQFQQPRTKTIVYNRLSEPFAPVVCSPFKLLLKEQTNLAFDECLFKNEQKPIVTTTLQTDFPVSLQAPVPIITSAFVEAIATHRLTLPADTNNTSFKASTSTSTSDNSRHSGTSSSGSNTSQKILLFSQRTEF